MTVVEVYPDRLIDFVAAKRSHLATQFDRPALEAA